MWKLTFDARSATCHSYGRVVFVEAPDREKGQLLGLVTAATDTPTVAWSWSRSTPARPRRASAGCSIAPGCGPGLEAAKTGQAPRSIGI